jgi:hypothetical protein
MLLHLFVVAVNVMACLALEASEVGFGFRTVAGEELFETGFAKDVAAVEEEPGTLERVIEAAVADGASGDLVDVCLH